MNKHQLAEWLHDNYEQLAKANDWQTQEITRVKFDDLPAENKATMLALADKMLGTFLIISSNVPVLSSLLPSKERVEVSNMVMKILTENTHIVDGQVRGVIVHGAVEKLTDIIMEMRKQIA